MSSLEDDGGLSSDIIAVEENEGGVRQSLWIGVRPIYHGNEPGEVMVQICYQEHHNAGALAGPVWLTPQTWRDLNAAVEWRLRRREKLRTRVWRKLRGIK